MTTGEQSTGAAERSAHVSRPSTDPHPATHGEDFLREVAPGKFRLRYAVERDELRAEVLRLAGEVEALADGEESPNLRAALRLIAQSLRRAAREK